MIGVSKLAARSVDPLVTPDISDVAEVDLFKPFLERPYNQLWFCANHLFRAKYQDL